MPLLAGGGGGAGGWLVLFPLCFIGLELSFTFPFLRLEGPTLAVAVLDSSGKVLLAKADSPTATMPLEREAAADWTVATMGT